jgi:murein DD-endopeptidase MepM/ murein hydrolase activator NlpD
MKLAYLLAPMFVFSACAGATKVKQTYTVSPGEVKWVEFAAPKSKGSFSCSGKEVKYSSKNNKAEAIVVANYFLTDKSFSCQVLENKKIIAELEFTVQPKEYKAEVLKVDPKKIKLSPKDQKRADAEQVVLNKVYASSSNEILFSTPFMRPLDGHVTSVYGIKRVYNGMKKGQHLGTDFRAAIGVKIPAANAGKIVFAGDLFYTGWTVIIDHGLDIFTVYGHLSKTLVSAGDFVKRGDIVALSGNTGRSSGPHLHWGVKVQGDYIDGFSLIDETKKVFAE